MSNLFSSIPGTIKEEIFEDLLKCDNIRIERILSKDHASPAQGWYDQEDHEWVLVLDGYGIISFKDGKEIKLNKGDYLNIPAHVEHKVKSTDPDKVTIWLAIFYKQ